MNINKRNKNLQSEVNAGENSGENSGANPLEVIALAPIGEQPVETDENDLDAKKELDNYIRFLRRFYYVLVYANPIILTATLGSIIIGMILSYIKNDFIAVIQNKYFTFGSLIILISIVISEVIMRTVQKPSLNYFKIHLVLCSCIEVVILFAYSIVIYPIFVSSRSEFAV